MNRESIIKEFEKKNPNNPAYLPIVEGKEHLGIEASRIYSDAFIEELLSKVIQQGETIQNQADKIATLVKQVETNGECHKGLTAKPCHCETIQSAHDKLKQRIEKARTGRVVIELGQPQIHSSDLDMTDFNKKFALVELKEDGEAGE